MKILFLVINIFVPIFTMASIELVENWVNQLCSVGDAKFINIYGIFTANSCKLTLFFEIFLKYFHELCEVPFLLKTITVNYSEINLKYSNSKNCDSEVLNFNQQFIKNSTECEVELVDQVDRLIVLNNQINIIFTEDLISFKKVFDAEIYLKITSNDLFLFITDWYELKDNLIDPRYSYEDVFRTMWLEERILGIVIISQLSDLRNLIFTYNPFKRKSELGRGSLETVRSCSMSHTLWFLSNLIRNRTTNLHGYEIKTVISVPDNATTLKAHSGVFDTLTSEYFFTDYFADILSNHINFVIEPIIWNKYMDIKFLNVSDQIEMLSNDFELKITDMAIYRFDLTTVCKHFDNCSLDFSVIVEFTDHCIVAPKASHKPNWILIFDIFDMITWLLTILSPIIVYIFWKFIWKKAQISAVFIIMIGQMHKLPIHESERMLIGTFLFASLIITGAFTSSLYTSYTKKKYYKDINTLNDLAHSNLVIDCPFSWDAQSLDSDNPIHRRLQKKLRFVKFNNLEKLLKEIAEERKSTTFLRRIHYNFAAFDFVDKDGDIKLYLIPECLRTIPFAIALPRAFFLRDRINEILGRTNEAGLWLYNLKKLQDHVILVQRYAFKENTYDTDSNHKKALSTFDLQLAFYGYLLGLLFAIITLSIEIRYFNRSNFRFINSH